MGFAIVGLGGLSLEEILPAFQQCKLAKVSAVMTGDIVKGKRIASEYGMKESSVYGYEEWHRLESDNDVQAVYIVTPNALHKDMVIQAASIGKHILCEKPMSTTSKDAQSMIDACKKANVKLMIAYRCQYEQHHEYVLELIKNGKLGLLKTIEAHNGQNQDVTDQWRHHKKMAGGGSLPDVGIYCLNFARTVTGEEPIEVNAWTWSPPNDVRFKEVEANAAWRMRFPSGIVALLSSSYDTYESRTARLHFEKGMIELNPAFSYEGIRLKVTHRNPMNEEINVIEELVLGDKNQFTLEIDHMAKCILTGATPKTSGEEGLKDLLVMEAIYDSANEKNSIMLKNLW